jgi:hypothetical protein
MHSSRRLRRSVLAVAALAPALALLLGMTSQTVASAGALPLTAGDLLVSKSVYPASPPTIVPGTTQLPPGCGAKSDPCASAVAPGTYPVVFNNDKVDGSFGLTSPITIDELSPSGTVTGSLAVPTDQAVTSFSSKSELGMNLSTDGKDVTFMGYAAPVSTLDVSNSNTPGAIDPTNPVTGAFYRVAAEMDAAGNFTFTETNAYSGNNGRAAILDNEPGAGVMLTAGNAGNGSNPEPAGVVSGAGAQLIQPSTQPEADQAPGSPTPVGSFNIVHIPPNGADKSAKDNNFRGIAASGNVLYYTKGSGGNGIDTVYFVDPTGNACPTTGVGLPEPGASLPTTSAFTVSTNDPALGLTAKNPGLVPENMCVLSGFPTALAKGATDASDYPFALWFANPTTLYVADEGAGDNTNSGFSSTSNGTYTAAAASTTAGLQKWVFDSTTRTWNLAYTLQSGLNLGVPYTSTQYPTLTGYPTGLNNTDGGGGLPWAPATDGLRNLTGQVNPDGTVTLYAVTSTVSGSGDQGADPNQVVKVTDNLSATTAPVGENFTTVEPPTNETVYRGVSLTPGTGAGPSGNVTCAGNTFTGTTIGGNLTVPAGSTCTLTDVTVAGNVKVDGGTLIDTASVIRGNLQTNNAAGIYVQGGEIDGNVQVQGTTGSPAIGNDSTANDLCGASVSGNVQVQNNGVGAPFDIGAAPDCSTPLSIGGNLQVQNNAGTVLVGKALNGAGNSAKGNIQVKNNTGGGSILDNVAGGNCQLSNNTPAITPASGNTAAGQNSCNSPA